MDTDTRQGIGETHECTVLSVQRPEGGEGGVSSPQPTTTPIYNCKNVHAVISNSRVAEFPNAAGHIITLRVRG